MTESDLILRNTSSAIGFSNDQVDLIKRTVAKDASDDELKLFLYHASKSGLDPLAKQLYFRKSYSGKGEPQIAFITAIDGYRLTAMRTGEYVGCEDAVFDNEKQPNKATVVVYRMVKGHKAAFPATARFAEYCPGQGKDFMWRKMPCTMLAKVAEALALRKAFPAELGGMYVKEEFDQAGDATTVIVEAKPEPAKTVDPVFDLSNSDHLNKLGSYMGRVGIPVEAQGEIAERMDGKSFSEIKSELLQKRNEWNRKPDEVLSV